MCAVHGYAQSYLLGLDWRLPRDFLLLKQREKKLTERKREARGDGRGTCRAVPFVALRHSLARAKDSTRQFREQTALFQVHEAYVETMEAATQARTHMS